MDVSFNSFVQSRPARPSAVLKPSTRHDAETQHSAVTVFNHNKDIMKEHLLRFCNQDMQHMQFNDLYEL